VAYEQENSKALHDDELSATRAMLVLARAEIVGSVGIHRLSLPPALARTQVYTLGFALGNSLGVDLLSDPG
jgi:hypothetical protein